MTAVAARFAGVIRSPRATLEQVATRPRWGGMLLLTTSLSFACSALFLNTEVGQLALVDQWESTAIAFGTPVGDAEYARFSEWSRQGTAYAAATSVLSGPVLTFGVALVLFGGVRVIGAAASWVQVLALVTHAGVILALRQIVATPFHYALETMSSPMTLVRFAGALDETSPVARFLGSIDLFVVWWVVVLAIGMAVAVRRPAGALALAFTSTYIALALLLAAAMALTGGNA